MLFAVARELSAFNPGNATIDRTHNRVHNVPPKGLPRGYDNADFNASLRALGVRADRIRPT